MRRTIAVVAATVLLAACTQDPPPRDGDGSPTPSASAPASPDVVPSPETGRGSALAALRRLCTLTPPGEEGEPPSAEGPTPPAVERLMREIEELRGFGFTARVVADPVTRQEIAEGYAEYVDQAYPAGFYDRRSLAWATIGVIPEGTSLRDELLEYGSTQVIGYYDTVTGELVFEAADDLSPLERFTLAHELVHAIDDQRFGLESLDALAAQCRDEELDAAVALVEGNATFFMLRWAQSYLTADELTDLTSEAAGQAPPPSDIPPFVSALQEWPYTQGLAFVQRLEGQGGIEAIDDAFLEGPVSTEQVIHPERFPNDVPTPVDVPDVADALGAGWEDLDVQLVGEAWLRLALGLRLEDDVAEAAAAGWDGGIYRAWTDGEDVALVLATAWDSPTEAEEFARAMQRWIDDEVADVLPTEGTESRILFASDPATLDSLVAATG